MPLTEGDRSFLLVRSGAKNYAISTSEVVRVVRGLVSYPLPGSRIHLMGLAQYGGEPLPVLDLHSLVEGRASGTRQRSTVILGRGRRRTHSLIGLAVDEVFRVIVLTEPDNVERAEGFVTHAVEFEGGSVSIVNTGKLLSQGMDTSEAADG